jgi:hypothetical protein
MLEALGSTAYVTVPELTPLAPVRIVNQPLVVAAVHGHGLVVITLTEFVPPVVAKVTLLLLLSAYVHPACVTVKVWSRTVIVPERGLVVIFGSTV